MQARGPEGSSCRAHTRAHTDNAQGLRQPQGRPHGPAHVRARARDAAGRRPALRPEARVPAQHGRAQPTALDEGAGPRCTLRGLNAATSARVAPGPRPGALLTSCGHGPQRGTGLLGKAAGWRARHTLHAGRCVQTHAHRDPHHHTCEIRFRHNMLHMSKIETRRHTDRHEKDTQACHQQDSPL